MNIELKASYGYVLHIEADNVDINEDIEKRTYAKTEDGKIDYTRCTRDISEEYLEMIEKVLYDMIYFRVAEYDSSNLIEYLFDKLPEENKTEIIDKLNSKL